jgi:hypothetical protein
LRGAKEREEALPECKAKFVLVFVQFKNKLGPDEK